MSGSAGIPEGREQNDMRFGGGPDRQKSIEMGFQVDLCSELHARLHANCDEWAKTENLKWKMFFQMQYEQKLIESGIRPEMARECWMALIGRNYL